MNKLSLDEGRIKQKLKTRFEILSAAKRLMRKSKKLTLEEIAAEANISRATIYRYFSNIDLLIKEASLDIQHPGAEEISLKTKDLAFEERVLYVQDHYNSIAQENELEFRRYLSAVLAESITNSKKVRGARRVETLKQSLAPFKSQMSNADFKNLINIASILMGIDALTVSKDVCDLNNEESASLLNWGMRMILKGMEIDGLR